MRRRLVWLFALAGLVWLYLRRGGRRPEPVTPPPAADDPADELRRKLDETRARVEQARDEPPPTAPVDFPLEPQAPVVSEEVEAKRRAVHERARSATDDMRDAGTDTG